MRNAVSLRRPPVLGTVACSGKAPGSRIGPWLFVASETGLNGQLKIPVQQGANMPDEAAPRKPYSRRIRRKLALQQRRLALAASRKSKRRASLP